MSWKRSRAAYESDLATQAAPFVFFGTPLLQTTDSSSAGGYVPLHKQEVRDDRGRRRLHGAFTGGWSAGYFNTVGSKEGWTPSQFVSSRGKRHGVDPVRAQNLPQNFMDEEDLADAAESQKLGTSQYFTGIGGRNDGPLSTDSFANLLHMQTETAGVLLLKRMGWREGQGIGPKVNRKPRLGDTGPSGKNAPISAGGGSYLFAPDDALMVSFSKKTDRSGLGLHVHGALARQLPAKSGAEGRLGGTHSISDSAHDRVSSRGFGVGVLNDSSSGEDDPYEIGPKITRIRRIQAPKKTKKPSTRGLGAGRIGPPAETTKQMPGGIGHDGHDSLGGFVREVTDDIGAGAASRLQSSFSVPESWTPSRRAGIKSSSPNARMPPRETSLVASNSAARGRILGEPALPGHHSPISGPGSVQASGGPHNQSTQPTREAASAALERDQNGRGPYRSQPLKESRYRRYLEYHTGLSSLPPTKPDGMAGTEFAQELEEFYQCTAIFKPMAAPMASRFTAATSSLPSTENEATTVAPSEKDAAREAAKLGMFGNLTRRTNDFTPSNLLCKRFNVKPPHQKPPTREYPESPGPLVHRITSGEEPQPDPQRFSAGNLGNEPDRGPFETADKIGQRPSEQVFNAIFGDDDTAKLSIPNPRPLPSDFLLNTAATLLAKQDSRSGQSVSSHSTAPPVAEEGQDHSSHSIDPSIPHQSLPPRYPLSEASSSRPPPPFSSLYHDSPSDQPEEHPPRPPYSPAGSSLDETNAALSAPSYNAVALPAFAPQGLEQFPGSSERPGLGAKKESPGTGKTSSKEEEAEPPPAYSEGPSPLHSFSYVMATAGGASSILTQVQQGGPPTNTLGDVGADETITMDLRGTRFVLGRDELLTLPEFVLLSLFPNGLFPEGHMGGFPDGDAIQVDYDPASLQYMLDFFRDVAQSIPESTPAASQDGDALSGELKDDSSRRAGIIVLREDLDFYVIPPTAEIGQAEMIEVKRAAAKALLRQEGIFSGLKRSDEPGTTEAHLIEMLTAGGFNREDTWGHRAGEPNKAVVCSLALARLRSDIRGNDMGSSAVGMAQKLLLFWRKPARRCWWEGVELDNVEGVDGKLKVWIRRVWTLEMSVIGLR